MTPIARDIASVQTLPQLLAYRAAATPDGEAYRAFNPATHAWESWSWQHTSLQVQRWAAAIGAMQLPQAARIAILLPNGLNALCADQSALATGCVPVPLHAIDNPGSIAYSLADCEASMLILGQRAQCTLPAGLQHIARRHQRGHRVSLQRAGARHSQRCAELGRGALQRGQVVRALARLAPALHGLRRAKFAQQRHQAHHVRVKAAKSLHRGRAQAHQPVIGAQGPKQHDGEDDPEKRR